MVLFHDTATERPLTVQLLLEDGRIPTYVEPTAMDYNVHPAVLVSILKDFKPGRSLVTQSPSGVTRQVFEVGTTSMTNDELLNPVKGTGVVVGVVERHPQYDIVNDGTRGYKEGLAFVGNMIDEVLGPQYRSPAGLQTILDQAKKSAVRTAASAYQAQIRTVYLDERVGRLTYRTAFDITEFQKPLPVIFAAKLNPNSSNFVQDNRPEEPIYRVGSDGSLDDVETMPEIDMNEWVNAPDEADMSSPRVG